MSFKPLPPLHGISGGTTSLSNTNQRDQDSTSTLSTSTSTTAQTRPGDRGIEDIARQIWTETIWTNLSIQAMNLGLPKLPYFDTSTMLLSKEVNGKLWRQLLRLYKLLGPEQATLATPVMVEGGEVKWHSFAGNSRGQEADVFDEDKLRKQKY